MLELLCCYIFDNIFILFSIINFLIINVNKLKIIKMFFYWKINVKWGRERWDRSKIQKVDCDIEKMKIEIGRGRMQDMVCGMQDRSKARALARLHCHP